MDTINHYVARFKYPIITAVVASLLVVSFFLGSKYALDHLAIKQISPTQAANAMKDDHFWSSYRQDTLLISGVVSTVVHGGGSTVVSFNTDSPYGVQCSFANISHVPAVGQTIRVLTVAESADRLNAGVGLNNCLLL